MTSSQGYQPFQGNSQIVGSVGTLSMLSHKPFQNLQPLCLEPSGTLPKLPLQKPKKHIVITRCKTVPNLSQSAVPDHPRRKGNRKCPQNPLRFTDFHFRNLKKLHLWSLDVFPEASTDSGPGFCAVRAATLKHLRAEKFEALSILPLGKKIRIQLVRNLG